MMNLYKNNICLYPKMKLLIVCMILLILPHLSVSNGEPPDYIIIKSDTFALLTYPLEKMDKDSVFSIYFQEDWLCMRGYQAIWQIEDSKLMLTNIRTCEKTKGDYIYFPLKLFFSDDHGKVIASWFSGKLKIEVPIKKKNGKKIKELKVVSISVSDGHIAEDSDWQNFFE